MLKLDLGLVNFTKSRLQKNIIEKSILSTLRVLNVKRSVEISVAVVGDARMKTLNRSFRKKDETTDVLSFGFEESEKKSKEYEKSPLNMGEIVISLSQAKRQAKKAGKSLDEEMALLSSHGTIHLFGIDHARSKKEDAETENIQKKILKKMFKN